MESIKIHDVKDSNPFISANPFEDSCEDVALTPKKNSQKNKLNADNGKKDPNFLENKSKMLDTESTNRKSRNKSEATSGSSVEATSGSTPNSTPLDGNESYKQLTSKSKSLKKKIKKNETTIQETLGNTPKPPKRHASMSIRKTLRRGATMSALLLPKSSSQSKLLATTNKGKNRKYNIKINLRSAKHAHFIQACTFHTG